MSKKKTSKPKQRKNIKDLHFNDLNERLSKIEAILISDNNFCKIM